MENLPEAPISLTFKVSYKGIDVLATKRDAKAEIRPFLENAKIAIDWALSNGFEVPAKSNGFRQEKPKKECPAHKGVMMTEKTSKTNGEKYFSHSKGVYPDFGEWCNGKGYPSEMTQQTQSNEEYDF